MLVTYVILSMLHYYIKIIYPCCAFKLVYIIQYKVIHSLIVQVLKVTSSDLIWAIIMSETKKPDDGLHQAKTSP